MSLGGKMLRLRAKCVVSILAVSVLVGMASSASAVSPSPAVSYVDVGPNGSYDWLSSAAPDGSSAVRLTSSNYQLDAYDVSDDGNTLVAEFSSGPGSAN